MANQIRHSLTIVAFALSSIVFTENFLHPRSGLAFQGDHPMSVSRIAVDHVRVEADKPFDSVTKAFEQQLGRFNPEVVSQSVASGEEVKKSGQKLKPWSGRAGSCSFRPATMEAFYAWQVKRKERSSM